MNEFEKSVEVSLISNPRFLPSRTVPRANADRRLAAVALRELATSPAVGRLAAQRSRDRSTIPQYPSRKPPISLPDPKFRPWRDLLEGDLTIKRASRRAGWRWIEPSKLTTKPRPSPFSDLRFVSASRLNMAEFHVT